MLFCNRCLTEPYYDTRDVQIAWELLLNVSEQLNQSETFKNDLMEVNRQVLSDIALNIHANITKAYLFSFNISLLTYYSSLFLDLIDDMDAILLTGTNNKTFTA